jgi:hypothetical protein
MISRPVGLPQVARCLERLDHLLLVSLELDESVFQFEPQMLSLAFGPADGQQLSGQGVVTQGLLGGSGRRLSG